MFRRDHCEGEKIHFDGNSWLILVGRKKCEILTDLMWMLDCKEIWSLCLVFELSS